MYITLRIRGPKHRGSNFVFFSLSPFGFSLILSASLLLTISTIQLSGECKSVLHSMDSFKVWNPADAHLDVFFFCYVTLIPLHTYKHSSSPSSP